MSSGVSSKSVASRPIGDTLKSLGSPEARNSLLSRLFVPVDIASLVFFRIAFGALMLWEVVRYYQSGYIERLWIDPGFHFSYYGFGWVQPWPGAGMYIHFIVLGLLAVFIMTGLWYRASAALFFIGFTYIFLTAQAHYLNHFYLICLISFLMIFVPAHRAFSIDAARRPALGSDTAPAWALWIIVFQVGIVYFFGGVAKLNGDWLRGEPMRMWLADTTDFPVVGRFFTEWWAPYLFSYGGLLLDLFIVPFLLWRRTRIFAVAGVLSFHLMNANLFTLGVFPWFMIAATTLFFPPDWPRRVLRGLGQPSSRQSQGRGSSPSPDARSLQTWQYAVVVLLGVYVAVQLLVPLRHHLYPGNVSWTEEGHRFSWHMKLRSKGVEGQFFVTDPARGETWEVDPGVVLAEDQVEEMMSRPDMVLQFSHYVADEWREAGREVEVRADIEATLNSRDYQQMIDPTVDLAAQPRAPLMPTSWIVPLQEPLLVQRQDEE